MANEDLRTSLRLPAALVRRVRIRAAYFGVSVSAVLADTLDRLLPEEEAYEELERLRKQKAERLREAGADTETAATELQRLASEMLETIREDRRKREAEKAAEEEERRKSVELLERLRRQGTGAVVKILADLENFPNPPRISRSSMIKVY